MSRSAASVLIASLFLVTCSKKNAEVTESPTTGAPGGVPRITDRGAKGAHNGPDTSFNLAVTAPAAGPAGAEAIAKVSVTPSEGWHMNKEYPTKLKLTPPDGVQITKAVLEIADAAKLEDNLLAFDVKLIAAKAGTYKVDGEIKFAVCTPETCDPKKQAIAFELVAQ